MAAAFLYSARVADVDLLVLNTVNASLRRTIGADALHAGLVAGAGTGWDDAAAAAEIAVLPAGEPLLAGAPEIVGKFVAAL